MPHDAREAFIYLSACLVLVGIIGVSLCPKYPHEYKTSVAWCIVPGVEVTRRSRPVRDADIR